MGWVGDVVERVSRRILVRVCEMEGVVCAHLKAVSCECRVRHCTDGLHLSGLGGRSCESAQLGAWVMWFESCTHCWILFEA